MNFRDEYKKEISELTSDETAERIRRGVTDKLAEPEAAKKRPLPLRRIAVIGGSVAACLVIGVTALVLTVLSEAVNRPLTAVFVGYEQYDERQRSLGRRQRSNRRSSEYVKPTEL